MAMLIQFAPIILIGVMGYLLLVRPQMKQAKLHREMIAGLLLSQASAIGVTPYRFAGWGSAPARSSRSTSIASLFLAAQCSATSEPTSR